MQNPQHIRHLPALDGLRGLAVLGVLCFHAEGLLRGGYLGVDLFFVLSGFLITSLLIAEHEATGRIALGEFWKRRARRLFPALLLLVPFIAVYATVFARWTELRDLRRAVLATLGYVANWAKILEHRSYWDLFAAPSPLEHTWSLAIEEQFYVVWPLFVMAVFWRAKRRTLALGVSCWLLAIASAVAMVLLYRAYGSTRAYFGTDTRGAAILLGAGFAAWRAPLRAIDNRKASILLDVAGTLSAVAIAVAWATLDGQSPFLYQGGFWLTEIAALALIACALQGARSRVARALSLKPLRLLGDVSYGVYLWHWPVFVVLNPERTKVEPGLALTAVRLGVTFAIAGLSYRLVEQPIRRGALAHPGRALVVALTAALGITFFATRPQAVEAAQAPAQTGMPALHDLPAASTLPAQTLRLLLVGDSVANALGRVMRDIQHQHHAFVAARGRDDCSILEGVVPTKSLLEIPHRSGNCAQDWAGDVAELKPDATLIAFGGGYFAPAWIEGQWHYPCSKRWAGVYLPILTKKIESIRPLSGKVFLARVPEPVGGWMQRTSLEQIDCFNVAIDVAGRRAATPVIDMQNFLCPQHQCKLMSQGAPVRADGLHFDGVGARDTGTWLLNTIRDGLR